MHAVYPQTSAPLVKIEPEQTVDASTEWPSYLSQTSSDPDTSPASFNEYSFPSQHADDLFCAIDRFVFDELDDPFASGFHECHFTPSISLTRSAPQYHTLTQKRIGSPVDTLFSSASGSGHWSLSNAYSVRDPASCSPVARYASIMAHELPSTISAPHHGQDTGITLRDIQPIADHTMSDYEYRPMPSYHGLGLPADLQVQNASITSLLTPGIDVSMSATPSHASSSRDEDALIDDTIDADYEIPTPLSASDSDADYKPTNRSARKPRPTRRTSSSSSRITKPRASAPRRRRARLPSSSSRSTPASTTHSHSDAPRLFTCPLALYGCHADFSTKNEWKRHVSIQHLVLGLWRCDLCSASAATRPNDFNRKDLFNQHCYRMHAGTRPDGAASVLPHGTSASDRAALESAVAAARERCWIPLRDAPTSLACPFCVGGSFAGPLAADEWLEHVGRHLQELAEPGDAMDVWARETSLRAWLLRGGLIERQRNSKYVLVDRGVAVERALRRRNGEEVDAEGDIDEDDL